MTTLKTKCERCNGTGRVDVTGLYLETYMQLRKVRPGYVVAGRDYAMFGCNPTALNNRLAWLERHGLATSERYGRERRYRAT